MAMQGMRSREAIKGHLDLLLLQIVSEGPAYGYQVVSTLRERSAGVFDLVEGTVYPALHRLERQGLLASRWDSSAPRRRRVYSLTAAGVRQLSDERHQWRRFVTGMTNVLGATA